MTSNIDGAAAYLAPRRILTNLRRRLLDAQRHRDAAARSGNSVAAYAFGLVADEMAAAVNDAEAVFAEERAVGEARVARDAGEARVARDVRPCGAVYQRIDAWPRVTRTCAFPYGHAGEHSDGLYPHLVARAPRGPLT